MLFFLRHVAHPPDHRIPGGSAANVVKGICNIAGSGARCRFVGMIGADETGGEYRRKLAAQGVEPLLLVRRGAGLSVSVSLDRCKIIMFTLLWEG